MSSSNVYRNSKPDSIGNNVESNIQDTQYSRQYRAKISRTALIFIIYFIFNFLIFLYTLFYFYWLVPSSIEVQINLKKTCVFSYRKTRDIFIAHFISTLPAMFIAFVFGIKWIMAGAVNYLVRNENRKACIKNAVETIAYVFIVLTVLDCLGGSTRCKLVWHGIYIVTLIKSCFSRSSVLQKLARVLILLFCVVSNIFGDSFHFKGVSLLQYLKNNNIDSRKYEDFLRKCNFDIRDVSVFESDLFTAAFSCKIGAYALIAVCDNLINPLHFDTFKMVFFHELGHCNLRHFHIILCCVLLFTTSILIYLIAFLRKEENNTLKKYAGCLCSIFIAAVFFEMFLNSFSHLLEFQADAFASKHEPQLIKNLVFALLAPEKLSDSAFLGEHPIYLDVNPKLFIYPTLHPFYTHPSLFERIKRLGSIGMLNEQA